MKKVIIGEAERRQIAWYYYESDLSVNEIAIMYQTNPRTVNNLSLDYQEWYL